MLLKFIGKNIEPLIVVIPIDCGPSLQAVNYKFQANLGILEANGYILFHKFSEWLLLELYSLFIHLFNKFKYFLFR